MGRPNRLHYPGALFHVFGRGNDQQEIFLDDHDRIVFLERLKRIKTETGFSLYAYCLMGNHYHFLIRVADITLSDIMHRLLTGYSSHFNRKWERKGHLFEGRFKDIHCARDSYFLELVRYINMNPVAAGIVSSPEVWKWSGYRELLGDAPPRFLERDFVLSMFGGGSTARNVAKDFILRSEGFDLSWIEADCAEDASGLSETSELPRTPLHGLMDQVANNHGLVSALILSRARVGPLVAARREFVLEAARNGYRTSEISRFLKRSAPTISRMLAKRNDS